MKNMTQREFMRELYQRFGGNRPDVVQHYASAERDGIVNRKRNMNQQTPEQYAEALFADGIAKGWLAVDVSGLGSAVAGSSSTRASSGPMRPSMRTASLARRFVAHLWATVRSLNFSSRRWRRRPSPPNQRGGQTPPGVR